MRMTAPHRNKDKIERVRKDKAKEFRFERAHFECSIEEFRSRDGAPEGGNGPTLVVIGGEGVRHAEEMRCISLTVISEGIPRFVGCKEGVFNS